MVDKILTVIMEAMLMIIVLGIKGLLKLHLLNLHILGVQNACILLGEMMVVTELNPVLPLIT